MTAGITFPVDDVEPAAEPLPERDDLLEKVVRRRVLVAPRTYRGVDATVPRIIGDTLPASDLHPLVAALHRAYSEHRPFVLTPDAVAIAMTQGVALHLRQNRKALRGRFVRHAGKRTVSVDVDDPTSVADWEAAIGAMADRLAAQLGRGPVNLFTRPFSTTGPVEAAAARIALMDAFAPYFDYEVVVGCGIPSITLAGTPDDWRDIRARLDVFAEWDLGWWATFLRPLCDQWIATAEGRIDSQFWQRIYTSTHTYIEQSVTGWIVRLFPYLLAGEDDGLFERNPFTVAKQDRDSLWLHAPVTLRSFPSGLSAVETRVVVKDRRGDLDHLVDLVGGFVGVAQAEGLALSPQIGWAVCEAAGDIWRRLEQQHKTRPAPRGGSRRMVSGPALLIELYARYRSVVLWGGVLRVRPTTTVDALLLPGSSDPRGLTDLVRFADLDDGSFLAYVRVHARKHPLRWAVVHGPGGDELDLTRIRVVAGSPLELFQKLLDGDAPYFLDPAAALGDTLAAALERAPIV